MESTTIIDKNVKPVSLDCHHEKINSECTTMAECSKRKNEFENDDSHDVKKVHCTNEEKKIVNLRKNIRDVMDENQLDTNTLVAQREESERLARVAEQQKTIREYQRQTAVNRHFVRTQNRVISLLQGGKTSLTDGSSEKSIETDSAVLFSESSDIESPGVSPEDCDTSQNNSNCMLLDNEINSKQDASDIVTIDDSSSEDDCILLSDDECLEEEIEEEDPNNSGLHVNDAYNVSDDLGRVVVNIGHPEGEEDIFIAPQIAKTIKPHQIGGVRFLYDNIIESTKRFSNSTGFGCILSHSMGLGKTLQVVCFCDIFLRYTTSKTVLCVMPINTLQNWVTEFNMWLPKVSESANVQTRDFDVFVLNDQQKTLSARAKVISKWSEDGGVLLIGYELFRLLSLKLISKRRTNKNVFPDSNKHVLENIYQSLVKPGPDLVICDEGHRIKNAHAGISLALKQIRTRRRIVLTGYPLQNNLLEYWCMVDFVRPNYLGNRTEFCNMFERPIHNGQCIDSTPEDIKLMRYRAHVLHSLLVGFVQRRSHLVLQQSLPQKLEYVVLTRMSTFQRKLYNTFMNDIVRTKTVPNPLKAFAVCCKIWNHPDVLYNFLKKKEIDLDLEIEDPEVSNELGTTTNKTHDHEILNSTLEKYNTCTAKINKNTGMDNALFNTSSDAQYIQSAVETYSNNPNVNNYWPEQVSANIGYSTKPNFVGIVVKETNRLSNLASDNVTSSSEIVDLDTKEIRTIKTDINISNNPIIKHKSDIAREKKSQDVEDKISKQKSIEEIKSLNRIEKDYLKKGDDRIMHDWAYELMKGYEPGLIGNSPKMEVFFLILQESVKLGDRVLLFSQSLLTLNLIENILQVNNIPESNTRWIRNTSYFRLDGSTTSQERERLVTEFNANPDVKLFLISTRAGSLGINLIGANRVIVLDASWNPCHDTQAVCRIYRYGQTKQCFVYRIVMDRCLEKKIYDRQIKKQGMADRVVDECNPDAHLSLKDVSNLCHDYDDEDDKTDTMLFSQSPHSFKDTIMQKVVVQLKKCLSKDPFYHDSLLIDRKEKKLSQAEKRQAHRGYELEKKASIKNNFIYTKNQYRISENDGNIVNKPIASIRPIQTSTAQNLRKCGGLRSTRWIPAEVWQRQGMTAQEMTLPLDVVIPTNSSDKSNIILKAGQRVMVLKSVKGIYMQLESGKIIAIRTSNKVNETKSTKSEVIDITSDAESISDTKTGTIPESNSTTIAITKNCIDEVPKATEVIGDKETVKENANISESKYGDNSELYITSKNNNKLFLNQNQYENNTMELHSTLKIPIGNSKELENSKDLLQSNLRSSDNHNFINYHNMDSKFKKNEIVHPLHRISMESLKDKKNLDENFKSLINFREKDPKKHSTEFKQNLPLDKTMLLKPNYINQDLQQKTSITTKPLSGENKLFCDYQNTTADYSSQLTEQQFEHYQQPPPPLGRSQNNSQHKDIRSSLPFNLQRQFPIEGRLENNGIFGNSEDISYSNQCNVGNISFSRGLPAQFSDYTPYGSYNHPPYHSYFQTNTYGGSHSQQMGPTPYSLHWPSLMNSAAINEQCSTFFSSNYSPNLAPPSDYLNQM